ncbi:hypothetical protein VTJ04DRAFT_4374 [Mycothermus thermophilus]|uniref:uncharacterized protein n=1 Tax=Humicola insolens TaxID=85995 RepID=UPI003742ACBB
MAAVSSPTSADNSVRFLDEAFNVIDCYFRLHRGSVDQAVAIANRAVTKLINSLTEILDCLPLHVQDLPIDIHISLESLMFRVYRAVYKALFSDKFPMEHMEPNMTSSLPKVSLNTVAPLILGGNHMLRLIVVIRRYVPGYTNWMPTVMGHGSAVLPNSHGTSAAPPPPATPRFGPDN